MQADTVNHSAYQINSQQFLLTWPALITGLGFDFDSQCRQIINQLLELIKDTFGPNLIYSIVCIEKHQNETPHCHAFCKCKSRPRKSNTLLEFYGRIPNVETVRITPVDTQRAIIYVKKDGVYLEFGEIPNRADKKTYKEKKALIMTKTKAEWVSDYAANITDIKLWTEIRSALDKPYEGERKVYWYFGETGTGKTRKAVQLAKDSEKEWGIIDHMNNFFNGYTGQEFVIFDDFRINTIPYQLLLRLIDRYPITVNIKGSTMPWKAETIIITCPVPPTELYKNRETGEQWDNLNQLIRRIQEFGAIVKFPEEQVYKYDLETLDQVEP